MASSLLRLSSRSTVRSASVSATLLPTVHISRRQHSEHTRSSSSPAADNTVPNMPFDLSYLRTQMQIMTGVPSISFTMANSGELTVNVPGLEKSVTDLGPCVTLHMPGVQNKEIKAAGFRTVIEGENLLILVKTDEEVYLAGMKLPERVERNGNYNALFTGGVFNLYLPKLKDMASFVDSSVKINRPTAYCVMFDRADLGQKLCGLIADPVEKCKSFTLYKKDIGESIYMKRNMPGVEKMVVTREGLCVSLNMPGLQIEDVESGFEYDALIIEGRRENEHYIAGVRVPEGFQRENTMIKREMQDGVYKATLAHVDGNRRVFSVYR